MTSYFITLVQRMYFLFKNQMRFLMGEEGFRDLPNVTFVKA